MGQRRIAMTRYIFAVAMTLLGISSMPATAQVRLDMSLITCNQWLNAAWDKQNFMRAWMSGYFSASRNNNVLDFRRLKRNEQKVTAYCKRHKSETLMSAIQKNAI
jgi:acid stress chaperone HdeB